MLGLTALERDVIMSECCEFLSERFDNDAHSTGLLLTAGQAVTNNLPGTLQVKGNGGKGEWRENGKGKRMSTIFEMSI